MRDIIFRAKRRDNKNWIEGYYYKYGDNYCIIEPTSIRLAKGTGVLPETVGQFVGLCDKNGNKIWEGDIVKNEFGEIAKVTYIFGRCTPFNVYPEYRCFNCDLCEVIGNIHDNPELLKER